MNRGQLFGEVAEILRLAPLQDDFSAHKLETIPWIGRTSAAIERWDITKSVTLLAAQMALRAMGLFETIGIDPARTIADLDRR